MSVDDNDVVDKRDGGGGDNDAVEVSQTISTPAGYGSVSPVTWASSDGSSDHDVARASSTSLTSVASGSSCTLSLAPRASMTDGAGAEEKAIIAMQRRCPAFRHNATSSTIEPFRDFTSSLVALRAALCCWLVLTVYVLYKLQQLFCTTEGQSYYYYVEHARYERYIAALILVPMLSGACALVGAALFGFGRRRTRGIGFIPYPVVFRVVSRGRNLACLEQTVRACREAMRRNAYFPYLIEVITDAEANPSSDSNSDSNVSVDPSSLDDATLYRSSSGIPITYEDDDDGQDDDSDVIQVRVPYDYETPHKTLFKARALHYACKASVVPDEAWIVHLDEETRPTSSGIKGIAAFIADCERRNDVRRIGQGSLLYHRAWRSHRFLTLADMRRTGEDICLFHLQHRLGVPLFGLHGAFIVCRADAEKELGFDVGPEGSVTEDAWWALLAITNGNRFAWIDGFLAEQCTESLTDFIKQRRRWNYGLLKVALHNPAPLRFRLAFSFFFLAWLVAPFILPFQLAYAVNVIARGVPVPMGMRILTLLVIAVQVWVYIVGWLTNVREGLPVAKWSVPFWTFALILLYPVFQVLEIVSLCMSFFAGLSESGRGFHVVKKSVTAKDDTTDEWCTLI